MVEIFQGIGRELEVRNIDSFDNENDNREETIFCTHACDNLLHVDDKSEELLLIPVFLRIKPTQGPSFLLHILLSMGRFETEIDLKLYEIVKSCFRYAVLSYDRFPNRSEESYDEQKFEPQACKDAIDSYCDFSSHGIFTKNIIIRGFPGSGKHDVRNILFCVVFPKV